MHKAYWVVKDLNMDLRDMGEKRLLTLSELEEFKLNAYKSVSFTKKRPS